MNIKTLDMKNMSVDEIVRLLRHAAHMYYNTKTPIMTDKMYDNLVDRLYKLDKNNNFFAQVGSPIKGKKIKLPLYMSSLDKIKIVDKWLIKYKGPYHLSDKIDGVSAQIYIKNKNIKMYTRGDGFYGRDITHLLKDIDYGKVDFMKIGFPCNIRGELIILKKDFRKLKGQKNARNTVTGIVTSNKYDKNVAKYIKFYAYDIMYPKYKVSYQYKLLKKWGFYTPSNKLVDKLNLHLLNKLLKNRRKLSLYDIDGVVVRDNNVYELIIGKNPKYAFAFKNILTDQLAETKVIKIEWNISKDKIMVPLIFVQKVVILNTEINKVSGKNAKYIKDNGIGVGTTVQIIKSGDVIPQINSVLKGKTKFVGPMSSKWEWQGPNIVATSFLTTKNKEQYEIILIYHFFKTLGVKNMGKGIITKLYKNGYNTLSKILHMNVHDFEGITGLGTKIGNKIIADIKQNITNVPLYRLMVATNIFGRGFGKEKLKTITKVDILKSYKNHDKLRKKLINIPHLTTGSINKFIKYLPKFIDFLKKHPIIGIKK